MKLYSIFEKLLYDEIKHIRNCKMDCPYYHLPDDLDFKGCAYKNITEGVPYIEERDPTLMCSHSDIFKDRGLITDIFDLVLEN